MCNVHAWSHSPMRLPRFLWFICYGWYVHTYPYTYTVHVCIRTTYTPRLKSFVFSSKIRNCTRPYIHVRFCLCYFGLFTSAFLKLLRAVHSEPKKNTFQIFRTLDTLVRHAHLYTVWTRSFFFFFISIIFPWPWWEKMPPTLKLICVKLYFNM